MVVPDTGVVLDRLRERQDTRENVTIISTIEYPPILEYTGFRGRVFYPRPKDFKLAYEVQGRLCRLGKMKGFADLLMASICINRREKLLTKDVDFKDIAEASDLEVEITE